MSVYTILILIAINIFTVYNIYVFVRLGVPENISATYYLLEKRHLHLGLLIPLMTIILGLTMTIAWIGIDKQLIQESYSVRFLLYVGAVSVGVIAVSSDYKRSKLFTIIHYTGSIITLFSGLLWIVLMNYKFFYIPLISSGWIVYAALLTGTLRQKALFWFELMVIYSVQIMLFVLSLMF